MVITKLWIDVETAQAVAFFAAAFRAEAHEDKMFAEDQETILLVELIEQLPHRGILHFGISPASVTNQVMVGNFAGHFVDLASSQLIAVDQAIAAERFQIAIHRSGAYPRRGFPHFFENLVEGGMLAAPCNSAEDELALWGESKAKVMDSTLNPRVYRS